MFVCVFGVGPGTATELSAESSVGVGIVVLAGSVMYKVSWLKKKRKN